MEGSSTNKEEEVPAEKNATFYYLYHPCNFLLKAVFKCLGLEIGTKKILEHKSLESSSSDSEEEDEDPITLEGNNNASNKDHKSCSQEVLICGEEEQSESTKQECSTSQGFTELITSLIIRKRSRGSDISDGSGPQTN